MNNNMVLSTSLLAYEYINVRDVIKVRKRAKIRPRGYITRVHSQTQNKAQ